MNNKQSKEEEFFTLPPCSKCGSTNVFTCKEGFTCQNCSYTSEEEEDDLRQELKKKQMNKKEFEEGYAKRSKVTVQWLHEHGQEGVPCDCEEEGCKGWQMVNKKMYDEKLKIERNKYE